MSANPEAMYSIPARFRKMENMHIVFWLLKDISWCMFFKELGIAMIIPTLTIAIMISWRTRHIASELAHNLAVALWITANSFWMVTEFMGIDDKIIGRINFDLLGPISKYLWGEQTENIRNIFIKDLSIIPFMAGGAVLIYYYLFQRRREIREKHTTTL